MLLRMLFQKKGAKIIILYWSEKNGTFFEKLGYKLANDTFVVRFEV